MGGVVQLPVEVVATNVAPVGVVYQRYWVTPAEVLAAMRFTVPGPQVLPSVTLVINELQLATTVNK